MQVPSFPTSHSLPYAVRIALVAVGIYAIVSMLSLAQGILLPVIYAVITAILISPLVDRMEHKGLNRALSTLLVMLVTLLAAGIIALLAWQLSLFSDQWPELRLRGRELWDEVIGWSARNLNISKRKVNAWLEATTNDLMQDNRALIGTTITSVGEALATLFLTPVYVFMMVLYKEHVITFIRRLSGQMNTLQVSGMMDETRIVVRSYLVGLSIEFSSWPCSMWAGCCCWAFPMPFSWASSGRCSTSSLMWAGSSGWHCSWPLPW
jgi:predicted PurR-regulated permease PerM